MLIVEFVLMMMSLSKKKRRRFARDKDSNKDTKILNNLKLVTSSRVFSMRLEIRASLMLLALVMITQQNFIIMQTKNCRLLFEDEICSIITQQRATITVDYEIWEKLFSRAKKSTNMLQIANDLLKLLKHISRLYAHLSKRFSFIDQLYSRLKYALEWVTTTNSNCERFIKRTYHYLILKVLQSLIWKYSNVFATIVSWSSLQTNQLKHLFRLIFAWTYILSSRWIEILVAIDEKTLLFQKKTISDVNFWDMIIEMQWQVIMIRSDTIFYALWCMQRHTVAFE